MKSEFFFDDLSDGVPECVAAFRNLQSLLGMLADWLAS